MSEPTFCPRCDDAETGGELCPACFDDLNAEKALDAEYRLDLIRKAETLLGEAKEGHGHLCMCPICFAWWKAYQALRDIEAPGRDLLDPWSPAARENDHVH